MITSAICKASICDLIKEGRIQHGLNLRSKPLNPDLINPNNWKRVTKRGSKAKGFVRQFKNIKVQKMLYNIHSGEHHITSIKRSLELMTPIVKEVTVATSTQTLKEQYDAWMAEGNNEWDFIYELNFASRPTICPFENLPDNTYMTRAEYYEEGADEELDFENREVINVIDNTITIFSGGDWQHPGTWTATADEHGVLHYNNDVRF